MHYRAFYTAYTERIESVDFNATDPRNVLKLGRAAVADRRDCFRRSHPGCKVHRGLYALSMVQDINSGDIVWPPKK